MSSIAVDSGPATIETVTTEERFNRLEGLMERMAERTNALDDALVSMAQAQERLYEIQADEYARTQEQFRRVEEQFRQGEEQFRQMQRKMDDQYQQTQAQFR